MFKHQLPADDLIEIVNLGEKRDVYFKNLSGGLKQRVGVAISMVNDPDIIFLDEPTTGLDPVARREVWEVIKDLKSNGKTIILTTHYMEEAEVLSDRVGIIDRGKFITMGSPNDIIDRYGTGTTMVVRGGDGSALEKLQGLSSKVERKGNDIVVNVDSKDVLPEAIMRLHEGDVHYEEIMLRRSTLEDVFLTLTGKRLENGEEVKKKGRGKK